MTIEEIKEELCFLEMNTEKAIIEYINQLEADKLELSKLISNASQITYGDIGKAQKYIDEVENNG